jgi:hypothetical protein
VDSDQIPGSKELVRKGEKMKMSNVGIVAVAILLAVTGVGFGIAQAGGNHTDRPVLSFDDQELLQVAKSPAEDFDPFSRSEDMQLESPIETGAIPAAGSEESWMKEYGHD